MAATNPGDKEPQEMRPYFDPRITMGNVLTILGGIATAASFVLYMSFTVGTRLDRIEDTVNQIRCVLAWNGLEPTTGACVLPREK